MYHHRLSRLASCAAVLVVACSDGPAYHDASYDPPPPTTGGTQEPAQPPGAAQGGDATDPAEPTLEDPLATGSEAYAVAPGVRDVYLNGQQLSEPDFRELESHLGKRPEGGRYWYDPRSGLWGIEGHGAGGVTKPGLRAAPVMQDASAGLSEVVVNGRALTPTERDVLIDLLGWDPNNLASYAGSYTLDADGKFHKAGGRYLGNLATKAKRARADGRYANPAIDCALTLFGGEPGVLGRGVTVNCD